MAKMTAEACMILVQEMEEKMSRFEPGTKQHAFYKKMVNDLLETDTISESRIHSMPESTCVSCEG